MCTIKRLAMLLLLVGLCLGSDCQGNIPAALDVSVGGFGAPAATAETVFLDSDGDGLSDSDESLRFSDPLNPDTDSDGLLDGEEVHTYGTDPTLADTDADSLSDGDEVLVHGTSPLLPDTDQDGLSDGLELDPQFGSNPLDPDTDGDGILDGDEITLLLDLLIPNPIGSVADIYCSDYINVTTPPLGDRLYQNKSFTNSYIPWLKFDAVALSSSGDRLVNLRLGTGVMVDQVGSPEFTDSINEIAFDGSWIDLTTKGRWRVTPLDQLEVSDWSPFDTIVSVSSKAPTFLEYLLNPNTCEIVQVSAPAYDPTARHTWTWGSNASDGPIDGFLAGTASGWYWLPQKMRLEPGTYTVEESTIIVKDWLAGQGGGFVPRLWFFVYNYAAPNHTEKIEPLEVTGDIPDTGVNGNQTVVSDFTALPEASRTFTVNEGDDIRIGYAFYAEDGRTTGRPRFRIHNASTEKASTDYELAADANGSNPPTPTVTEASFTRGWAIQKLILKTNAATITSDSAVFNGTTLTKELPVSDLPYWVVLEDVSITAGFALTVSFEHSVADVATNLMTAILDMGDTDQVTFNGNNVPLVNTAEAGESFDFYFYLVPNNKSIDCFWGNRTTGRGPEGAVDFAIFNHTTKVGTPTRGRTLPTMAANPSQITISQSGGVSNVERVYVCRKPVVVLGDSQSINHLSRIGGQLPSAFTQDRVGINAAISGNRISQTAVGAHTRGDKRYCSDTPGLGDICDMRDIILAITNYAANDIPNGQTVNQIVAAHEVVILDAIANGNEVILMGITPLADFHADVADNATRLLLNASLQNLAAANGIAWFNPYNDVLANQATYLDSGGLHLTQAGSEFVTSQLTSIYEAGG